MDLRLDEDQAELLQEVLSVEFRDLRMEISHTDNAEYREALRAREQTMGSILDQVGGLLDLG